MLVVNKQREFINNHVQNLDIRGKICPLTFVYTKLALEKMRSGEILEVLLDFPAAVNNIPKSCERQNLGKLLDVKKINKEKSEWILLIERI
ncbi:MAG: sulfurtransferase TusA family protein [Candidatus Thorarchaeota archaeon]